MASIWAGKGSRTAVGLAGLDQFQLTTFALENQRRSIICGQDVVGRVRPDDDSPRCRTLFAAKAPEEHAARSLRRLSGYAVATAFHSRSTAASGDGRGEIGDNIEEHGRERKRNIGSIVKALQNALVDKPGRRPHRVGMRRRYAIRPHPTGWTVFDVFTGMPVVIAMDPQTGLSEADAREIALLLNGNALAGDRRLMQ